MCDFFWKKRAHNHVYLGLFSLGVGARASEGISHCMDAVGSCAGSCGNVSATVIATATVSGTQTEEVEPGAGAGAGAGTGPDAESCSSWTCDKDSQILLPTPRLGLKFWSSAHVWNWLVAWKVDDRVAKAIFEHKVDGNRLKTMYWPTFHKRFDDWKTILGPLATTNADIEEAVAPVMYACRYAESCGWCLSQPWVREDLRRPTLFLFFTMSASFISCSCNGGIVSFLCPCVLVSVGRRWF
jgi:hypothetical protein